MLYLSDWCQSATASTRIAPVKPPYTSVRTLAQCPTATVVFLDPMSSPVIFGFTPVRNPFSVAFACALFHAATTSLPIFGPTQEKNRSLVISVVEDSPDRTRKSDMPKSTPEPEAEELPRRLRPQLRQPRLQPPRPRATTTTLRRRKRHLHINSSRSSKILDTRGFRSIVLLPSSCRQV